MIGNGTKYIIIESSKVTQDMLDSSVGDSNSIIHFDLGDGIDKVVLKYSGDKPIVFWNEVVYSNQEVSDIISDNVNVIPDVNNPS